MFVGGVAMYGIRKVLVLGLLILLTISGAYAVSNYGALHLVKVISRGGRIVGAWIAGDGFGNGACLTNHEMMKLVHEFRW